MKLSIYFYTFKDYFYFITVGKIYFYLLVTLEKESTPIESVSPSPSLFSPST